MPRGATWQSGLLTRQLTGGQPQLTGGQPQLTGVLAEVNGGPPPLTGGGSGDSWQATWHQSYGDTWHSNHEVQGTIDVGTRSEGSVRVGGRNVRGNCKYTLPSRNDEIDPRSGTLIGWQLKKTKLPLSGLGYLNESSR
ncbi:hypothetical protein Tco_1566180 [Tanacetum coccineum]